MDRKVKLNGVAIAGQTLSHPRVPSLILGNDNGYVRGDILDANAVQTKINEILGGAPDAFDTLKELADRVQYIATYTHIHHPSDGTTEGPKQAFIADADSVKLNFQCTNTKTGTTYQHPTDIPIASATQAGIITADTYEDLKNKVDSLRTFDDNHYATIRYNDDDYGVNIDAVRLNEETAGMSIDEGNASLHNTQVGVGGASIGVAGLAAEMRSVNDDQSNSQIRVVNGVTQMDSSESTTINSQQLVVIKAPEIQLVESDLDIVNDAFKQSIIRVNSDISSGIFTAYSPIIPEVTPEWASSDMYAIAYILNGVWVMDRTGTVYVASPDADYQSVTFTCLTDPSIEYQGFSFNASISGHFISVSAAL